MTTTRIRRRSLTSYIAMGTGLLVAVPLVLLGCATPEGTLTYYLPKAETAVKVTQTLTCNAKGDTLVQVADVSSATIYASDLTAPVKIRPKSIDGFLSNADIAFTFTNDGRLSGVNITTVGQGGEVVKDILAFAKAVAPAAASTTGNFDAKAACGVIARYAAKPASDQKKDDQKDEKKKATQPAAGAGTASATPAVVTLVYESRITYARTSAGETLIRLAGADPLTIPPNASSAQVHSALSQYIPGLGFYATVKEAKKFPIPAWMGSDTEVTVKLNSAANVVVEVQGLTGDMSVTKPLAPFWRGEVPVPLTSEERGDLFDLPIPKAAVFGTRKFSLSLTDYGSINKIQYATTNEVSESSAAFAAIGSAWAAPSKSPTSAQQAEAVKADADLIYQQQRKAACIAKPETCQK